MAGWDGDALAGSMEEALERQQKDGVAVFHRERSLFEREGGEWRFVSGGAIPAISQITLPMARSLL